MKRAVLSVFLAAALGAALCACTSPEKPEKKPDPQEEVDLTDFKLTKEYFEGKNVVVYGASIDSPPEKSVHGNTTNWVNILKEELGFELLGNFSIPGYAATHSVSVIPTGAAKENLYSGARCAEENTFYNELADFAFIIYGGNDFNCNAPMGENTDDPQSYRECTTFKGSINFMVKKLRAANPEMRIVLLTPLWSSKTSYAVDPNKAGYRLLDYADALYELAEPLECKIIDQWPCFNAETFGVGLNSDDGIHPDDNGYAILAEYLLGK